MYNEGNIHQLNDNNNYMYYNNNNNHLHHNFNQKTKEEHDKKCKY
jgi:hypothetical protein